jgi:hypothetical protein
MTFAAAKGREGGGIAVAGNHSASPRVDPGPPNFEDMALGKPPRVFHVLRDPPTESRPSRMKTTMPRAALSRRRLLATGAAALAFPGAAFAQQQQQQPLFPPFPQLQFPRPHDPNPAKPEPQQITEDDWFVGTVQDGPFEIRKVNMELLDEEFRRQLVPYSGNEQPGTLVVDPRNHFL